MSDTVNQSSLTQRDILEKRSVVFPGSWTSQTIASSMGGDIGFTEAAKSVSKQSTRSFSELFDSSTNNVPLDNNVIQSHRGDENVDTFHFVDGVFFPDLTNLTQKKVNIASFEKAYSQYQHFIDGYMSSINTSFSATAIFLQLHTLPINNLSIYHPKQRSIKH